MPCKETEREIRQIAKEHPCAMILMKENVGKVSLVRIFPEPDCLVERIVKVRIENHLADERRIEKCRIEEEERHTHRVTYGKVRRDKRPRH